MNGFLRRIAARALGVPAGVRPRGPGLFETRAHAAAPAAADDTYAPPPDAPSSGESAAPARPKPAGPLTGPAFHPGEQIGETGAVTGHRGAAEANPRRVMEAPKAAPPGGDPVESPAIPKPPEMPRIPDEQRLANEPIVADTAARRQAPAPSEVTPPVPIATTDVAPVEPRPPPPLMQVPQPEPGLPGALPAPLQLPSESRPDPPSVKITIGRIDVRAEPPKSPVGRSRRPSMLSLEEYIGGKAGRRR